MPWEKTFDIDLAVDRATDLFWAKGYDSTSLAELVKTTGVNKGSFYNAFGSKKQLFITCLNKYEREQRHDTLAAYEALQDPIQAIGQLFDELIKQSQNDGCKKGCFLVNTAVDLPNHEPDIQAAVNKALRSTEQFFAGQVKQGIQSGVLSSALNPQREAQGLLTLLVGLRVLARGVFDEKGLEAIKYQALRMLGVTP